MHVSEAWRNRRHLRNLEKPRILALGKGASEGSRERGGGQGEKYLASRPGVGKSCKPVSIVISRRRNGSVRILMFD